jgi:S-formylglutathione hydrolase FrmB
VREWPLLVVMPDGYRGFYTDNEEGPAYARHIGRELVDFVDRNFQTIASRAGRAIGGLSMGGYGALRVGLGFADRFCSVNSHSGALGRLDADFTRDPAASERHRNKSRAFLEELRKVFGERPHGSGHDLMVLARAAREKDRLPAMLIDCGREDLLLAESREFHRALKTEGIPHEYHEHAGAHDWDYWDRHVQDAVRFHGRNLGITRVAVPRLG